MTSLFTCHALVTSFFEICGIYRATPKLGRCGQHPERPRDSERSTIVFLYEGFHDFIWEQRNARTRMTLYEHLEWLHVRWTKKPPKLSQRICERVWGAPFPGRRAKPST